VIDDRRFSAGDINRWAEDGLISREQAAAILSAEAPAETPPAPQISGEPTDRPNTMGVVFSYIGVGLALLGLLGLIGNAWDGQEAAWRAIILTLLMTALLLAGWFVRRSPPYRWGGNLLFIIGTAMFAPTLFALGSLPSSGDSNQFLTLEDSAAATALLVISIVATAVLSRLARIPPGALVTAVLAVSLGGVLGHWIYGDDHADAVLVAIALAGAVVVAASAVLMATRERDLGIWLGVGGHGGFLVGTIGLLLISNWTPASGLTFAAIEAAVLALSVPLKNREFLAAGVIGFYAMVFRVVFDVGNDGAWIWAAFMGIGVSLILLAMFYQRARREWAPMLP
jgi:Predicted membrane protein (DUF2157)